MRFLVAAIAVLLTTCTTFHRAGCQRFVLRERVDAEQCLYVDAMPSREVRRFVWVQTEKFLPDVAGRYEYDDEPVVMLEGRPFHASTRRYTTPPDPGSDRARAYALVESRGYTMPKLATRVRFVHVPADDPRSELMIVYAETGEVDADTLLRRAMETVPRVTPLTRTPR